MSRYRMPSRRVARAGACGLVAIGAFAAISTAHDEDWRKFAALGNPFHGPKMTKANGGAAIAAGGFPSENVELLAWIPLNKMPGNQLAANDCWGYVSPSGREYAIACGWEGIIYYDITDPGDPQEVGYVPGPALPWHDVKVIGSFAYGVSEGGLGIQVMDLTNIDAGMVVHVGDFEIGGHSTTHNIIANPDSGYIYLAGANIENGGLVAVDVSEPASPQLVGSWSTMYVHDAQVVTYTEGPYAGREIAFCAAGFNGGGTDSGLRIVDVTDKADMFLVGEIEYEGAAYSHQCWLSEDRQYLYLNDEADESNGIVPSTTTRVFDVSDLSNPTFVSDFTNGAAAIDHNHYVHNGLLFQSNYHNGLRVWDLADPAAPTEVAYFDTFPENDSAGFAGTWSNYPFFPSGTVIVNDGIRGLFILDVIVDTCAPDFNGDGSLDILDFVAFQNAFQAGDESADFNGDGVLNILDFVDFQNAFQAGC